MSVVSVVAVREDEFLGRWPKLIVHEDLHKGLLMSSVVSVDTNVEGVQTAEGACVLILPNPQSSIGDCHPATLQSWKVVS